jgi:uroporphyrinogen-III synthase
MHVLLTRPLEDSIDLIKRLKDKGFTVSHLPLIKINKIDYPKLNSLEYKIIVFTSSNAVRNLDTKDFDKNILCFCVGDATEKTAKQKGFYNTFSAGGNVRNLRELILQNSEKKTEKILYISGELVSYDLDKDLIKEGLNVQRLINYGVSHIENLSSDFLRKFKKKMPDIVYV